LVTNAETFKNVPGGTAHWSFAGGTNYNDRSGTGAVVIGKADASCSIVGYSGTYDAHAHGASGSCAGVDIGGTAAGSSLSLGASYTNVPGGTAHWVFTGGTNYNDQAGDVAIVLAKADPNCTVTPYAVTYNANAHSATGSCAGVVDEATPLAAIDFSGTTHTNAGNYTTDTWTFTDTSGNYLNDGDTITDSICNADASCVVTPYSGTYDGAFHGIGVACSGVDTGGAATGGSVTNTESFKNVPGGTAHWSFAGGTNYNDRSGTGAVVIGLRSLAITANDRAKTYGDTLSLGTSSFTTNGNEAVGEHVTAVALTSTGGLDASTTAAAGAYPGNIIASGATGNGGFLASNYDLTYVPGKLTIHHAHLTVTADNKSKVLNAANPPITYQLTGFKNSEGTGVVSGSASCSTTALTNSPVGTYPITCAIGTLSAANYDFPTFVPGTLTVGYALTGTCLGSPGHAILQPIDSDDSSVFKQGSTVPAKFRVCDANGVSMGTPGVVTDFKLTKTLTGTIENIVNEDVISTTPDTAFRWSLSDQQWIFNINTKNLTKGKTYVYRISLNDGSAIDFMFGLK
jgi:hypothetical protein